METKLQRYQKLLKKAREVPSFNTTFLKSIIETVESGKALTASQVISMVKVEGTINAMYDREMWKRENGR